MAEGPNTSESSNPTNEEDKTMSINIKLQHDKHTVEISSKATVGDLKVKLAAMFEPNIDRLCLIFSGRILKDDQLLSSQKVTDGVTMHLVIREIPKTSSENDSTSTLDSENTSAHSSQFSDHPAVRSLLENMHIGEVLERNPDFAQIFNNRDLPEVLQNALHMMTNPSVMQEMVRSQDRAMSNLESLPGGFNVLSRLYRDVEQPMMDALSENLNHLSNLSTSQTRTNVVNNSDASETFPNPWSHDTRTGAVNLNGSTLQQLRQSIRGVLEDSQLLTEPAENQARSAEDIEAPEENATNSPVQDNTNHEQGPVNANSTRDAMLQFLGLDSNFISNLENVGVEGSEEPIPPSEGNAEHLIDILPSTMNDIIRSGLQFREIYQTKVEQMVTMGFTNTSENLAALIDANGDINAAVDIILSHRE